MHNSRFHSLAARLTPHGLRTSLRSRRSRSSSSSSRTSSSDGEVERLVSPTSSTASRSTLNRAGSNMSSLFGIRLVPSEPEDEEEKAGPKELTNVLEPRPTDDMYFCSLEEKMQMPSF
ncbi:hypothetical protein NEUTE1DRAFT_118981 [Neurospora tetrasperma FGSC 2508]|uniref:Uncharacterized protein n=1 Tax=Neurospora tetrasperma (strain FGSC 2508 / ATCC MYA-4615 / P0657) TaxID=510951 RepID=F8MZV4_NEUT8|nr:uncharacterized protein NEUTE1DRAFT_118981 [Neurospora tetrasperma FGSC 2508]EGO52889.1 hypothetical protein NEUTE1DRAFT_118981 [Neurospora tetrasperma FGSC 2508]